MLWTHSAFRNIILGKNPAAPGGFRNGIHKQGKGKILPLHAGPAGAAVKPVAQKPGINVLGLNPGRAKGQSPQKGKGNKKARQKGLFAATPDNTKSAGAVLPSCCDTHDAFLKNLSRCI
jgi:hypothetical protein